MRTHGAAFVGDGGSALALTPTSCSIRRIDSTSRDMAAPVPNWEYLLTLRLHPALGIDAQNAVALSLPQPNRHGPQRPRKRLGRLGYGNPRATFRQLSSCCTIAGVNEPRV